jgi:serine/threonine protein kinase
MTARHVPIGQPVHEAEARGIQALIRALPDNYWVFTNLDLAGDRRGQTFEHDAIVVAPHAVVTVELKSWGGRITGNRDRWSLADGTLVQSPIPLILSKARILKGRLQSRRRDLGSVWVHGLVLLSAPDASAQITRDFADYVVTLDNVKKALTDPAWLGHPTSISLTQRRAIEDFLRDGQPIRVQHQLEDFRLVQRLAAEDRPFEAWLAERHNLVRERRVLHAYAIAGETEADRDRLRAHALREATLHTKLRGGPDILRYDTYFVTHDDPQRIVLQFEDTTPLQPMDQWVRDKRPGMGARLAVAARIARALAWVHEKSLVHRRLSPDAVLVSPEEQPIELRLCAFELARDLTGTMPTITGSSLGDPSFRYAAPEVLRSGEATPRADLFSLGATLVELFTDRLLFASVDEVLRPFTIPPLALGDRPVPRAVAELIGELLAVDPAGRPDGALRVAQRLEDELRAQARPVTRIELAPDEVLRGTYELIQRLGRGATATTWKARQLQTDHMVVLKIADAEHARYLQEEGRVLGAVHHPHLVRFHNVEPFEGGNLLVLEYVDGVTAALWAGAGDPLDPPRLLTVARGLFGALAALHRAGWVHRDVKPDNVMLAEADASPKLLDLGLAAHVPVTADLAVGSIRYKDPLVYVQNQWTPANDLFSAALVLYELLTGTHPFGGNPPEPDQAPTIQPDELPDSYDPAAVSRLTAWFTRALSPIPTERPRDAASALRELEQAVSAPVADPPAPTEPTEAPPSPLPTSATLATKLSVLDISTRAEGALARLGRTIVADLVGFDVADARGLPNVGSKTLRELTMLVAEVAARWPGQPRAERPPVERFYPALGDDPRPLDQLGRDLTPGLRAALLERGVFTIGDIATMPPFALAQLPSVGPAKLASLRAALRRLAGREPLPETLAELEANLAEEVGDGWAALVHVLGLRDGRPRSQSETAALLGVSRQRVSQVVDLDLLRADASWGRHLANVVSDAMPPAGFATLEVAATALNARLPSGLGGPSAIGYSRLAGLVLLPDARATDAAELRWVIRPPWTEAELVKLQQRLGERAIWPPLSRRDVETDLWDHTPVEIQRAMARWGADSGQLLDRLLELDDHVLVDRVGGLYTPPVELSSAIQVLRPSLQAVLETAQLLAEVHAAYRGVAAPDDVGQVDLAIERGGYRRDGDRWVDPLRIGVATRETVPRVDPTIPTQRASVAHRPPVVGALASQVDRGGFRVVGLAPAAHHMLARRLATWLSESLGTDRVSFLAIDRLVVDALKAADLWKFVPYYEARPDADWRMFHGEVAAALDAAVAEARPGRVTVLGHPSLLGPLGLMDWLSGFYERARGGTHGLIVLAVPGGIHEDRVRLNEKYNLPYTPDMAAVYLEADAL